VGVAAIPVVKSCRYLCCLVGSELSGRWTMCSGVVLYVCTCVCYVYKVHPH